MTFGSSKKEAPRGRCRRGWVEGKRMPTMGHGCSVLISGKIRKIDDVQTNINVENSAENEEWGHRDLPGHSVSGIGAQS
jgi:hypothetical protein